MNAVIRGLRCKINENLNVNDKNVYNSIYIPILMYGSEA